MEVSQDVAAVHFGECSLNSQLALPRRVLFASLFKHPVIFGVISLTGIRRDSKGADLVALSRLQCSAPVIPSS